MESLGQCIKEGMSAPKKNWDKSQFELRKKAFERRDGVDSSSISEDEGVLSGRRYQPYLLSCFLIHTLRLWFLDTAAYLSGPSVLVN